MNEKYQGNTDLVIRAQAGDKEALAQVIELNRALVRKIAYRYLKEHDNLLTMDDLLQEGVFGLMEAIKRFEPERDLQFSTIAFWWVRHALSQARDPMRPIRLPVYQMEASKTLRKSQEALESALGRPCTIQELSEKTGVPVSTIHEIRRSAKVRSLSLPTTEDLTLEELIADPNEDVEEEAIRRIDVPATLSPLLACLKPRERTIIEMRFGLAPYEEMTLWRVGKELGISRERVRQIEADALAKMQSASRRQALAS